jgi:hypothetical protein
MEIFLSSRSEVSSALSGYKGPAFCLGVYRSLVIGVQGGHLITAHISLCLLHQRSTHNQPLDDVLPVSRDRTLETPLSLLDVENFLPAPALVGVEPIQEIEQADCAEMDLPPDQVIQSQQDHELIQRQPNSGYTSLDLTQASQGKLPATSQSGSCADRSIPLAS